MSGKQSKDLAVPTWFLPAIDLLYTTTAQKTTKITGIWIQIIKDIEFVFRLLKTMLID